MAALSTLYPLIKRSVEFCPDVFIDKAIIEAARTFCVESYYLERTMTVTMVNGQSHYDLTIDANDYPDEEIIAVRNAEVNGNPLRLAYTDSEFIRQQAGYPPKYVVFFPPATIELIPYPNEIPSDSLYVEVVTQPTLDAVTIPDDMLRKYRQCIADGAIAWLCEMPNQAWSNAALVSYHKQLFYRKVLDAKSEAMTGHVPRNLMMNQYRFLI